jgi:hypothetical protein
MNKAMNKAMIGVSLVGVLVLSIGVSLAQQPQPVVTSVIDDEEFVAAVERMHENGLTKYDSAETYRGSELLTREQAAKFFSQFSINVLLNVIDMTKYCEFDDLSNADPSLRNSILVSCLLNLFHGSNGQFFPQEPLTKAQAVAVLIRALEGYQPEDLDPWWYYYHARAVELGVTNEQDVTKLDKPVSRYEMALMLYRAGQQLQQE